MASIILLLICFGQSRSTFGFCQGAGVTFGQFTSVKRFISLFETRNITDGSQGGLKIHACKAGGTVQGSKSVHIDKSKLVMIALELLLGSRKILVVVRQH